MPRMKRSVVYNPLFYKTCLVSAWVLLLPVQAGAENAAVPLVSGGLFRDTARMTFEWPETTQIQAVAKDQRLTVTFDHKANPDFRPLLKQLYPYVIGVERKSDGRTFVFTLDKPYAIRAFANDAINGVELLHVDVSERMPVVAKDDALSALTPAAGEAKPVELIETGETPTPPGSEQLAADPAKVAVSVSAAVDNAVLRFPFTDRTAMAVFTRSRALYIAWNKTLPVDLSDFEGLSRTVIGKAEVVPSPGATVIRLPIEDSVYVSVAKQESTFDWAVLITPKMREMPKGLQASVNTDPPAPAHVFVPVLETAEPVTIVDPQIGDQIIITPFFSVGEGMSVKRDFVEFSLLKSTQGLAVVKKADEAMVTPLRNGLRISLPQGATLTPGLSMMDPMLLAGASQQTLTLFPYELWRPDVPEKQPEQIRLLFQKIVESETPQEANNARLRMAQLYLSQGMAVEAISFLDGINRLDPAFYRTNKLAALRGASNFLMYRFPDAARDFAAAELNNNTEVDYWRSMLADLLGNPDQNYDYLALNQDYISKYPPTFRQRLAIVAADRAIGGKDYNNALKVFDTLSQDNLIETVSTYTNFLMAKIAADTGQEKEALEIWDRLAEDYAHPFVRARAEFSRILWGLDHDTLPKDQAIDRLERLRTSWHGDSLELTILTMLGDMYVEQNKYIEAMRIWHGGVTSFPNTTASLDMSRKMQEAFITVFREGIADKLPPLEALALYYEYKNYMPTGNMANEIINRLADRLIHVDLLNQATVLLDQQMRSAAEKERRSEIGAKLATVYLLNRQPTKALQTLHDSVYGDNPVALRMIRNRLTAQTLLELGQSEKALQVLAQDGDADAERIRIAVFWKEKNWEQLASSVENMLKSRQDITAPVSVEESEYLLRLALAYVFREDRTQLQYLRDYFGPLMKENPNRAMFDFITGGDIQLTTTNFDDVIKNIADTRSFIENYRARITADGLKSLAK